MNHTRQCDVLVVGHGAAGCVCALRLARSGADVLVVGRGTTATALSTGRLDLTGAPRRDEVSSLLRELGKTHGLYQGMDRPCRAMTNYGTVSRQTLSSDHDWVVKDLKDPVGVMGFKGNPDIDPILVCSAMAGTGTAPRCRPYRSDLVLPLSIPTSSAVGDEAGATIETMASVIGELEEPTVIIPPLFAGAGHSTAMTELERASGTRIREAATPMSNPGRRLQVCLEDAAARAGCTLWKDRTVTEMKIDGNTAAEVTIRSGLREVTVRPKQVVLAVGGLAGGGLVDDGLGITDPLGKFMVAAGEARGIRSAELGKALATGIKNIDGQAVLMNGEVANNVFVAGSASPGLSYPLGRGLGHVIADALSRAEAVMEAL